MLDSIGSKNTFSKNDLHIGLVGPMAPPNGGMANQTQQLKKLLENDSVEIAFVPTNAPYFPNWISRIRGLRAIFRLVPYLYRLWETAGDVRLFHIMANSGWAWHLYAAPAIWICRWRRIPVVVNYRGGQAASFFRSSFLWVKPTLSKVDKLVVPSKFLFRVFKNYGIKAEIIRNVIDDKLFFPESRSESDAKVSTRLHIVVTRNLELIYDNALAIRAFSRIKEKIPTAKLTIAGSGPERENLEDLVKQLKLGQAVSFCGSLERTDVAELLRAADVMLNPSTVDNMPNSLLESLASGVLVVSTDVGGIPDIVRHEESAILVQPGNPDEMAQAVMKLVSDPVLCESLRANGLNLVRSYTWACVKDKWLKTYKNLCNST